MRVEYWCKYCNHLVGELDQPNWSASDAEYRLGLLSLSPVERDQWVAYDKRDKIMYVQTVCDYCQRAVESHPEVLLEGKLLQ
jgi:hypothetical protein